MRLHTEGQHSRPNSHASKQDVTHLGFGGGKVDVSRRTATLNCPMERSPFKRSSTTTNVAVRQCPRRADRSASKNAQFLEPFPSNRSSELLFSSRTRYTSALEELPATSRPWHARFVSSKLRIRQMYAAVCSGDTTVENQRWRSSHYTILANDSVRHEEAWKDIRSGPLTN